MAPLEVGSAMRAAAKTANFGMPSMPVPLAAAGVLLEFVELVVQAHWRQQYADERESPEWVDHGGES